MTEIYGESDSGKTALALHVAKQCTPDRPALYIDAENHISPATLRMMGIQPGNLYLFHADTLQDAMQVCKTAAPAFRAVILDSITSLPVKSELNCKHEDHVTIRTHQADVLSHALAQLTPHLHRTGCALILINQMRDTPGCVWNLPAHPTGGRALKYYAALRLQLTRAGSLREDSADRARETGIRIRVSVEKNKCAAPNRQTFLALDFAHGLSERETDNYSIF